MTPITSIGECVVSTANAEYFFRPSFMAMMRVGEPEEIVQAFHDLYSNEAVDLLQRATEAYSGVPGWVSGRLHACVRRPLLAAMAVLAACHDGDCSALTGYLQPGRTGRRAFVYRPGSMPPADIIQIARSLISHGIIGRAKVRRLQRHEGGEATTEFNAFEYISAARNHFGISRAEAEQLTMTEFQMMLSQRYPEQKGFTREEYDQVADDYLARKARRGRQLNDRPTAS